MSIINTFPLNLANGTTADATQVMSLFAWIQSQVNANAASSTPANPNVGFSVGKNISQTLPLGTTTATFQSSGLSNYPNTFISNPSLFFSTGSNSAVAPVSGWYEFNFSGSIQASGTGSYTYLVFQNTTSGFNITSDYVAPVAGSALWATGSAIMLLNTNDSVTVTFVTAGTGGSLTMGAGSIFQGKYLGV